MPGSCPESSRILRKTLQLDAYLVLPSEAEKVTDLPGGVSEYAWSPDGRHIAFDFEREWLAANGYVVLQVNYRGSAGRGSDLQKAIYGDWGHLEVVDLLASADYLVPLIGGEQMYQALRGVGVDTQLVIYPGQHHILKLPSYQRDRLSRYVAWYDRYLKPANESAP